LAASRAWCTDVVTAFEKLIGVLVPLTLGMGLMAAVHETALIFGLVLP
jgi:hypothetical protein